MTRLTHTELARDIERFLQFKHALGFSYARPEKMLRSFQRCCRSAFPVRRYHRFDLASACRTFVSRVHGDHRGYTAAQYLIVLRQLCLHRRRYDPRTFVPDQALAPQTRSNYVPYILSQKEVQRLLQVAGKPRYYAAKIPSITVETLMLILYCTGLRLGEAVRLPMQDVDLDRRLFTIRESKGRTRIVPFGKDLARKIRRYLAQSKCYVGGAQPRKRLLVDRHGEDVKTNTMSYIFAGLLRKEGLKPPRGRIGPRAYDFRHVFAVHRLTDWYRDGIDIHARLPLLSAYMGHQNVLGTEVYLHATPELLRFASERFKRRWKTARRPS